MCFDRAQASVLSVSVTSMARSVPDPMISVTDLTRAMERAPTMYCRCCLIAYVLLCLTGTQSYIVL